MTITRRYGLMTIAIFMAFASLLTGKGGSIYTAFWIYAAYLSYKGDIKTLKSYLIVLIWMAAIIVVGLIVFVDLQNLNSIFPGIDSYTLLIFAAGIPLVIKIAIILRINNLLNAYPNGENAASPMISDNLAIHNISEPQRVPNKTMSMSSGDTYTATPPIKPPIVMSKTLNSKINNDERKKTNIADNSEISQPSIEDWEFALEEYNGDKRKNGLWAKIFAENNGDENITKAQYLKTRAIQLSEQREIDKTNNIVSNYGAASNRACIENDAFSRHQSNFKFPIYKLANGNYAIYHHWKYKIYSSLEHLNNAIDTYERTELFPKVGLVEEYTSK